MSDITLRLVKGLPLTNQEVDDNFANLNTDKYQAGDSASFQDVTLDNMSGPITWNVDDGTVDVPLNAQVTLQLGQEFVFYAKATEAIANGDVVMFAGAQGGHLLIAKCDMGAVGFDPSHIVGVATQSFAINDFGYVTSSGKVRGIDTSGFTEGTILYVDPTTAGGYTSTKPTPPNHIVQIAAVTRSHATQGTVLTRVSHMPDTDEVPEGSTNLYYTAARAVAAIKADADWNATNWDTAYGWGDHAGLYLPIDAVTLPDQTGHDGQFLTTNGTTADWATVDTSLGDTAYGWGDHSTEGYLTSFTETDPTVPSHVKSITTTNISNWNTAYGWGDHSTQNYAVTTGDTFTGDLDFGDNVKAKFGASDDLQIYHDGSHSYIDEQGTGRLYINSGNGVWFANSDGSEISAKLNVDSACEFRYDNAIKLTTTSTGVDVTGTVTATGGNSTNWNTAYGWGDHSTQSYATQTYVNNAVSNLVDSAPSTLDTLNELAAALGDDPNFAATVTNSIGTKQTQDNTKISNWDTAYSWGNHASAGYLKYTTSAGSPGESAYLLSIGKSTDHQYIQSHSSQPLRLNPLGNAVQIGTGNNSVFHDGYHPNADKWTTARTNTVTLTGDASGSGSASVDGTGNWTVSVPVVVNNDSHSHSNYVTTNTTQIVTGAKELISTANHYSGHFYYDAYDTNGNHYPHFLDGSGSTGVRVNWRIYNGSSLRLNTWDYNYNDFHTNVRAPIFYDSNNTAYYADPASSSESAVFRGSIRMEQGNTCTKGIELNSVKDSTWPFEFTTNDVGNDNSSGFWVGSNGYPDMRLRRENGTVRALISSWEESYVSNGFRVEGTSQLNGNLYVGTGTSSNIYMRDSDHGNRRIHCNSNRIGFLNEANGWGSYCGDGGDWYSDQSIRSPIFYDSNDTGRYLNPASDSRLNKVRLYNRLSIGSNSLPYEDSGTGEAGVWLSGSATNATWFLGLQTASSSAPLRFYAGADRFTFTRDGHGTASGSYRAPIFYDSNNTGYYIHADSTSNLNGLNVVTLNTSGNTTLGNGNGDTTRVNDILYVQATDSGDAHFHFGENSSSGYGAYWHWDSGYRMTLNSRNAGTNTAVYYFDTNSTTYLNMGRHIHMQNKDINYVNQLHFNANVRFYDEGNDNYLNYKWGDTGAGGIKFYDGNTTLHGYIYGDGSGRFGLLDNDGAWAVRIQTGTSPLELRCNNNVEFSVYDSYTLSHGSSRSPIFYDSNNTGYYTNPASTSRLNAVDMNSGTLRGSLVVPSDKRGYGMFGTYSSYKTQSIWSMGTAYRSHDAGSNFGNLYGLAYKHTNNGTGGTMAGGHMMVWCQNGTPYAAMGSNIWTSGNVTAYSDRRVKTNLELIPNALEKVQKLNGYTFDRTDVKHNELGEVIGAVRQTGVVAQEVLEVLPEAVTGSEEEHYSVAYGNMVGLLIEAIKEQQTQIEELSSQIKSLKEK